jgi:alpha-galactosidase
LTVPYQSEGAGTRFVLKLIRQDFEQLERRRSVIQTTLTLGAKSFERGLGTHANSHIQIVSPEPLKAFAATVGLDNNERTSGGIGSVHFGVSAHGRSLYKSPLLHATDPPEQIQLDLQDARVLDLEVDDAGDGPACDHADWADATVTTASGRRVWLDELDQVPTPFLGSQYPFSFKYGEKFSDELLKGWQRAETPLSSDEQKSVVLKTWTDSQSGLQVQWEITRFRDFPALDWMLRFENRGTADTPILSDIQALDQSIGAPLSGHEPYRLHKTKGAPADPTDFEPTIVTLGTQGRGAHAGETLGGGGGRSSNKDFPFFKVETWEGSLIIAVGWSGQWLARLETPDRQNLHITAGLEKSHFLLHPGESIRTPRILELHWAGDTLESNAQFRQLIYRHYAATRNGQKPLPTLFSNTCFTRGGGWLNECNAANQISLINAYAPLGLQAVITDAGWFEGGWPAGAGNWTPRKDAYPEGMAPVAGAAKDKGMVYGLWFEPERVVKGTALAREHKDWILARNSKDTGTYLLNFGLPEARDYFFKIVEGFMKLPGFRFYRQDFNMDPLEYWRFNDPPDREGITESKYIEGLYAYWDRIRQTWPDAFLEECASGGRRIDIETIRRMHVHQESDYWFDNETDQCQIWGLSQYLPNNLFDTPLIRLDDYSFHSTLATSLIIGWIADDPSFDSARARQLTSRYLQLRPLLIGSWYPLLPYSRSAQDWMASQFHRPDLDEGMILAFRHSQSPYRTVDIPLHGLNANTQYELAYELAGTKGRATGAHLMQEFQLTLPEKHSSELIVYRKVSP